MSLAPLLYRLLLAGGNLTMGWVFHTLLGSPLGLALVAVGLLIVISVVGGLCRDDTQHSLLAQ
ncbi:hypothetical protein [Halovenus salina]|uniref:Uncharacterized protein n=1 Tax=Halovenus salina TaxID=1510225 RepID=A0ABD5W008_9EURY|nr:hypothetical protein [Halovenus salina]